jgi:hypothetical protein
LTTSGGIYRVCEDGSVMRRFGRFERLGSRAARIASVVAAAIVTLGVLAPPAPAKLRRPTQAWDPGIEEIAHRVERLRGLTFRHPVPIEFDLGGGGRLGDRDAAGFSSNPASTAVARHLRALGLLAPGVDLAAEYRALGAGYLGYYEPGIGIVHVARRRLDALAKEIVAHELTHALDDQHFHFERAIGPGELSRRASQAVIEGDARRIELLYRAELPRAERRRANDEYLAVTRQYLQRVDHPADIEWPLVESDAPYTLGRAMTSVVAALPGSGGVGTLLRERLDTDAGTVDPLQAGRGGAWVLPAVQFYSGEVADGQTETVGAVDLYLLLASRIPAADAFDAVTHLTGATVAWIRRGSSSCARISVTSPDADKSAPLRAIGEWVAAMGPSARIDPSDVARILFSSCEGASRLAPGAIMVPEVLLAARGHAIAKMLDAHHSMAQARCVGDAVLRDATYRNAVAAAVAAFITADSVPVPDLDAALTRGSAACGV